MVKKNEKPVDSEVHDVVDVPIEPDVPAPIIEPNLDVDKMLNEVTESMEKPSPDLVTDNGLSGVEGEVSPLKDIGGQAQDIYSDASGDIWDNTKHATGGDGKPIYTVKGLFRKRRSYSGAAQPDAVASRKVAEYSAVAYTQIGVAIFGEEWQPIINDKENEKEFLTGAFADYFDAKGIADIPPGLALAIALGGYSIRRIGKPETKGKLAKAKEWFKGKLSKIRIRKPKAKKTTAFDEIKE